MPQGKRAGERCVQLTDDNRCLLFEQPDRPLVCSQLRPSVEMCGDSREHAMQHLTWLELMTTPNQSTILSSE